MSYHFILFPTGAVLTQRIFFPYICLTSANELESNIVIFTYKTHDKLIKYDFLLNRAMHEFIFPNNKCLYLLWNKNCK